MNEELKNEAWAVKDALAALSERLNKALEPIKEKYEALSDGEKNTEAGAGMWLSIFDLEMAAGEIDSAADTINGALKYVE